jgi:hypothetical protein
MTFTFDACFVWKLAPLADERYGFFIENPSRRLTRSSTYCSMQTRTWPTDRSLWPYTERKLETYKRLPTLVSDGPFYTKEAGWSRPSKMSDYACRNCTCCRSFLLILNGSASADQRVLKLVGTCRHRSVLNGALSYVFLRGLPALLCAGKRL